MECLNSLQRLLDTSTFIVILQELLDHEDAAVRRQSLLILEQRLQELNENNAKSTEVYIS